MNGEKRNSGIGLIGYSPWGTHFCQFYENQEDLTDILVPYFKAGLENNEYCMWVAAAPLVEEFAREAMRTAMPDFDRYLEKGQIEIVPHDRWYLKGGVFDLQMVLDSWIDKLDHALKQGYEGLRVTGNIAWLEKNDWESFTRYEAEINRVIGNYKMITLCTYSLERCGVAEVIDVVSNHQFALIRRQGKWQLMENTERKQAEERIKVFSSAVAGAIDAITITDMKGTITYVNRAMEELYGYEKDEMLGKSVINLDTNPETANEIAPILINSGTWSGEIESIKKNKEIFSALLSLSMVRNEKGNPIAMMGALRDITERKRMEKERLQHEREVGALREADRLKDELLANVSHELRTPLANIKGYSSLLLHYDQRIEREERLEHLQDIAEATDRLTEMVERLLDLSRLQSGMLTMARQPASIATLIENALREAEIRAPGRRFIRKVPEGLPEATIDAKRIRQTLDNLLNNATKFSPEGTEITVRCEAGAQELVISVRDQGVGIAPEDCMRLFERFYRVTPKGGQKTAGAGLGLAICKRIVELHRGRIWVESQPGKGSTFFFTLLLETTGSSAETLEAKQPIPLAPFPC